MAIVRNGPAGGQEKAAWVLSGLAALDDICVNAIAAAGGIAPLVALVSSGAGRGPLWAAWALGSLA